jgi:hypothetical protein
MNKAKKNPKKHLTVRLDGSYFEAIKSQAQATRTTQGSVIRTALLTYFELHSNSEGQETPTFTDTRSLQQVQRLRSYLTRRFKNRTK